MNNGVHDYVNDIINAASGEGFEVKYTQFKEYRKDLEVLLETRGYDVVVGQSASMESSVSESIRELLMQLDIAEENGFSQVCISDQEALFLQGLKEVV